ncbi:MAG: cysteine--tRNA ligase [Candidatus Eremiobacteraeota bacterium]|nr:cysteine--tRNA ligase [Candidatus Eremiobacteraeota bacterium]
MPLRLYNTRTRALEALAPLEPDHVRVYVCGLTPSAEGHLGHARSFLFFDVLRRYLEHPQNGYRVTFVKNVTDIDDRAIATAQREGTTFDLVVKRFYDSFRESMRILNVREPDDEPYATHFIPQIVEMIGELIATDHAYAGEDGVYYAVSTFPRYGALSGKHVDELLVGARIAENEHKRDPLDFALWKFAKPGEPSWESPWGAGRPGWHIECSAMARALLGVPFDIHGGGYDLIFPHHENEIAQSEALMPAPPMAQMWVHGGLLNFDGRKMSKSLGNFEPLAELLKRHDPLAIRLLFLQTGYRKPMNFTEDSINGATAALDRLRRGFAQLDAELPSVAAPAGVRGGPGVEAYETRFFDALDEDMNTAGALGVLFDLISGLAKHPDGAQRQAGAVLLHDALQLFGLGPLLDRPVEPERTVSLDAELAQRLRARLGDALHLIGNAPESAIQAVIDARAAARKSKDFALSDRLRDALAAEGIALNESKAGTTWTAIGV